MKILSILLSFGLGSTALLRANGEPKAAYPLTTCVVSGEKLGEMGKPASVTYKGTVIEFCCKACVEPFNEDPDKYLERYDQAVKAAKH